MQRLIGFIFGITIGGSEFIRIYRGFSLTGWTISTPESSGCLSRFFIWALGFTLRLGVVGGPLIVILLIIGLFINLASRP